MLGAIPDLSRNADVDKHLLVGTPGLHMMLASNHHHLFTGLRHQINPPADGGCRTSGTVSSTPGSDTVSQVSPDALQNCFTQTEDAKGRSKYVTSWLDASRPDEPPSIGTTYKDFSSPSTQTPRESSRSNNRTTFSGVTTSVPTEVTSKTGSCEPWRLGHPMVSPITYQHEPGKADYLPSISNEQFAQKMALCQVNAAEVMDRSSRCSPPTGSHSYDNQSSSVASRPNRDNLDLVYQSKAMEVDEKEETYFDGFPGAKDRNSLLALEEQNSLEVSSETQNAMESSDSSLPLGGSVPPHHQINERPQTSVGEKCLLDMPYSPPGDQKWSTTDRALCIGENRTSCQQDINNTDDGEDESDEGMSMARFQQMTNSVQPDRAGVYFCHLCDFTGRSRQEFQSHLYAHYDYRCLKCDYTSRTEGRLKRHMKDFHSKVPPDNFSGKSIKTTRPKLQRCKQCNFVTETKDEFWQHLRAHIKEDKRLECSLCHFVTEYKHHMEYHMRNHEGSKPYKCSKCNYECVNKSMLNSHMKSHSNVYPYRCANCHYATKYCHSLKLHLAKHNHKPAVVLNADGSLPSYDNTEEILTVRRGSSLRLAATCSRRIPDLDLQTTQEGERFPANLLSGQANGPDSLQTSSASQFYSQTTSLPNPAGLMLPSPGLLDPCTFFFPSLMNQLKLSPSLFLPNSNNKQEPANGVDLSALAPDTRCASHSSMMASLLSTCMMNGINAKPGLPVKTEAMNRAPNFPPTLPFIPPRSPSAMAAFMAASCLLSSSGAGAVPTTNETDVKPIDYLTSPALFNEALGASSNPGTSPNPFQFPIAKQDNHMIAGNSRNNLSDYDNQSSEQDYKMMKDREDATINEDEFALDLSTKTTLGSVKLPSGHSNDDTSRRSHREDSSSVGLHAAGLRVTDRENNIIKPESYEDRTFAYECPYCEIRFRQRALYDVHMGFHSHQDPYLCNQCGHKSFDSVTFFIHLGKMAHYS